MKFIIIFALAFSAMGSAYAQHTYTAYLKDSKTKEPVIGATAGIQSLKLGNSSDVHGLVIITGIPSGTQAISFRSIGYTGRTDTVLFPLSATDTPTILLDPAEDEEMEDVVISSTRSSRTIRDIPTRIELIGGEELGEKANMKPGDIRMLLSESTGIQTLQTSATSGNSSIRMQGLDGRYTQILKDGFPLYAGFSGGLGLLQTPPLDLKQVEIIKGSSSTLYGGGAIAGLINLISKTPSEERELRFLVNGTSAGGLDVNGFYAQRFGKAGITMYAARNSNAAYDPAHIDLSAIPQFTRYTFNPKLFLYPTGNTDIIIGVNTTFEDRLGGDMHYISGNADSIHSYYEDNKTQRISTQFQAMHRFSDKSHLVLKNSVSSFNRIINTPGYAFNGKQTSTFTELSYAHHNNATEWIAGTNVFTDGFKEQQLTTVPLRNYEQQTLGAFVQNIYTINKFFSVESGLRGDYVINYGLALLPRVSVLYKSGTHFTSRLGGGLGYKSPTIFTEESERIQYQNILPISPDSNQLEKSLGVNWDFNYKTTLAGGRISFTVNQLFFYTRLAHPLMLTPVGSGLYSFKNATAHVDAQGAETNVKFGYKHFKLFLGYTYTQAAIHNGSTISDYPLTPRHHTNSVLMYEVEDKIRIGLEAYYYSPQKLSDGTTGRDYWLCGLMVEKLWKKFSLFINFENYLDSRQTRFNSIYTGSISRPVFKDIYAPLDGFVMNGGLKLNL